MIKDIVNYTFDAIIPNRVWFLNTDGNLFYKTIQELGYPYFYGIPDKTKTFTQEELSHIIKADKAKIEYIDADGIKSADVYRVVMKDQQSQYNIIKKFSMTFEAKIPYIRKLGLEGVIEWASKVDRYADIDIEERNGKIELIGYWDSVKNEYEPFYSIDDFVKTLKERKIVEIFAWNGDSYDFEMLGKLINDNYYNNVLKLDAMLMYSIFKTKPLRSLNQAGKENGIGSKVEVLKPFSQLTTEELATYNRQDVNLQKRILDETGVRPLIHFYANYVGMHVKDTYSQGQFLYRISATRIFDALVIRKRKPRVYLKDSSSLQEKTHYEGGDVFEPDKGIFRDVASYDYNSLYPHIVMYTDYPNFIYQFIKKFEDDIYNERLLFKQKYEETNDETYETGQKTLKILINSLYGIFANPYFRYYDVNVAEHITSTGRQMIHKMADIITAHGYQVIYADTDSCFVANIPHPEAEKFTAILNKELAPFEVKLEKFYPKMLFFGQ